MSQIDRVKALLLDGWRCGSDFIEAHPPILRYTARIGELRKAGWSIDRRPCETHDHGPGVQMWEWRAVGLPAVRNSDSCVACGGRLAHVSTCHADELAESTLPGIMG